MADEIIKELWKIKDGIADEYGYDVKALVSYLKTKNSEEDHKIVDLRAMKKSRFSRGWDEDRVKKVLEHYESQSEEEAVAEDEAAWEEPSATFIEVPNKLLPRIRELLAKTAL